MSFHPFNMILDETFHPVRISDMELNEDVTKPKGLSRNQICTGIACDDTHVYCVLEGYGKASQKKTYEAFKDHIEPAQHSFMTWITRTRS